jgi:5'-nucleotidase
VRILLTNDDGIESPGLRELGRALGAEHEVWIVAPEGDRSGSSHSITLGNPAKFRRVADREYASAGTPADCVLYAILGVVPAEIDIVLSGVNLGPNLGTDIVYSGTAAAARQGAFMRKPSVALSLSSYKAPYHLELPVRFVVENLPIIRELWSADHFLNINFPNKPVSAPPVVTHPARRIYKDELVEFNSPHGDLYCFLGGAVPEATHEDGSDYWAIEAGLISLSPIVIHPANHEVEERYREASFRP